MAAMIAAVWAYQFSCETRLRSVLDRRPVRMAMMTAMLLILTLMPGATMSFAGSDTMNGYEDLARVELRVEGTLWLLGTTSNRVTLQPASGSWYGVHLYPSATGGLLDYADIEGAVYGVWYEASATNTLTGTRLTDASTAALYVSAGTAPLENVEITGSSRGIWTTGAGTVDASNCLVHHNSGYGVYSNNNVATTHEFDHCTVADNSSEGFYGNNSSSGTITVNIRNSIVAKNSRYGAYDARLAVYNIYNSSFWDNFSARNEGDETLGSVSFPTDNLVANPLFADPASGDYELTHRSPARFYANDNSDIGARPHVSAQTPALMGTLWTDTTLAAGPHSIAGDLTVPPGVTLTLDAGADLQFASSDAMNGYEDLARSS